MPKPTNNFLVGYECGTDITDECNLILIGDNLKASDLKNHNTDGVLYLGDRIAIGETIMGKHCNLKDLILNK